MPQLLTVSAPYNFAVCRTTLDMAVAQLYNFINNFPGILSNFFTKAFPHGKLSNFFANYTTLFQKYTTLLAIDTSNFL